MRFAGGKLCGKKQTPHTQSFTLAETEIFAVSIARSGGGSTAGPTISFLPLPDLRFAV